MATPTSVNNSNKLLFLLPILLLFTTAFPLGPTQSKYIQTRVYLRAVLAYWSAGMIASAWNSYFLLLVLLKNVLFFYL